MKMTSKISAQASFILLLASGVAGMWLAEIWPDRFYWTPAACMGILRAYIVTMGPSVAGKDDLSKQYRNAVYWSWSSLVLFGTYLFITYYDDLGNPVHLSLQCVNIMLMGAEQTYGQWQANANELQSDKIEIANLKSEIAHQQLAINSQKEQNKSNLSKLNTLDLEHTGLKIHAKQLESDRKRLHKETENPVRVNGTHQVIRCKHCMELVPFGNATKVVEHCGEEIYHNEKRELELESV